MIQLLGYPQLRQLISRHLLQQSDDQEDDGDGDQDSEPDTGYGVVAPRRRRKVRKAFEKIPSEEGKKLMESGIFGTNDRVTSTLKKKKRLAYRLMQRELCGSKTSGKTANQLISQVCCHNIRNRAVSMLTLLKNLLPSTKADTIIHYDARCYSGQFSKDGNFFFSCAQDFKVRMYDTSNPYKWRYYKV